MAAPALVRPVPWNVGPGNVDPVARRLWQDLVVCAVVGEDWSVDLISKNPVQKTGAGTLSSQNSLGPAYADSTDNEGPYVARGPRLAEVTTEYTFVWVGTWPGVGTSGLDWVISIPYSTSWVAPYISIRMGKPSSATTCWFQYQYDGTYRGHSDSSTSGRSATGFWSLWNDGLAHVAAASRKGTAIQFWRDGQLHSSDTITANQPIDWGSSNTVLTFNHRSAYSAGEGMTGTCNLVMIFKRELTAEEQLLLGRDPFALLRRPRLRSFAPVSLQTITIGAVIASAESVYNPTVSPGAVTVSPSAAIATAEAVPNPTVTPGAVTVSPSTIATAESVPNPVVSVGGLVVEQDPTIASGESVPQPVVTGPISVDSAIATAESVPQPQVNPGAVTVSPSSAVASAEAVPQPQLDLTLYPDTTATGEAVPSPQVDLTLTPDSPISSGEVLYDPTLTLGAVTVSPSAIASLEDVYSPLVTFGQIIYPPAPSTPDEAFFNPWLWVEHSETPTWDVESGTPSWDVETGSVSWDVESQ